MEDILNKAEHPLQTSDAWQTVSIKSEPEDVVQPEEAKDGNYEGFEILRNLKIPSLLDDIKLDSTEEVHLASQNSECEEIEIKEEELDIKNEPQYQDSEFNDGNMGTWTTAYNSSGNEIVGNWTAEYDNSSKELIDNWTAEYTSSSNEVILPPIRINGTLLSCEQCTFVTSYKTRFDRHMSYHNGSLNTQIFKCTQCDYQSKYLGSLQTHMVRHTEPIKMFTCNKCNYQSAQKAKLTNHILLLHREEAVRRKFACTECKYQSFQKSNLTRHMLLHSGGGNKKIFVCKECNYQTGRSSNFRQHRLVHKDVTQIIMFKCADCDFQTRHKISLTKHVKNQVCKRAKASCHRIIIGM